MSVRNLISETQPIPINYTKSCYSFSDPATPKKNYLFSLELCFMIMAVVGLILYIFKTVRYARL